MTAIIALLYIDRNFAKCSSTVSLDISDFFNTNENATALKSCFVRSKQVLIIRRSVISYFAPTSGKPNLHTYPELDRSSWDSCHADHCITVR